MIIFRKNSMSGKANKPSANLGDSFPSCVVLGIFLGIDLVQENAWSKNTPDNSE